MMDEKDYEVIEAVCDRIVATNRFYSEATAVELAVALADEFQKRDPNFNRAQFVGFVFGARRLTLTRN